MCMNVMQIQSSTHIVCGLNVNATSTVAAVTQVDNLPTYTNHLASTLSVQHWQCEPARPADLLQVLTAAKFRLLQKGELNVCAT